MPELPTKQTFEDAYTGEAPWDIAGPQEEFVAAADLVSGSVLDAGCGTGENALFFAEHGCQVTGIDFLAEPIARANKKAAERGLSVDFRVADALELIKWPQRFDNVIDSGLFHTFSDDDRRRYVDGLAHVLKPGGRLLLMCFSDAEPPGIGPRRVSKTELQAAFARGWAIESIKPSAFALNSKFPQADQFSPGGPKTWFIVVRRSEP